MQLFQIDAFAAAPFRGNPAAVCFLDRDRDAAWMQKVAAEMNLSETAFLLERHDGWSLRWFTPKVEVDLCGHATLASAHAIWREAALNGSEELRFHTRSGVLKATQHQEWIELDFPSLRAEADEAPPELLEALGARPRSVHRNKFDYLLELDNEAAVRALHPDMAQLKQVSARGVVVTSRAEHREFDFVSRFFAPAVGVDEDPVTGSAHCSLAPFWAERLEKPVLTGYQASARGGVVRVRLAGDRVFLGGQAVTVFRGELVV